jgi:hypothetical protein
MRMVKKAAFLTAAAATAVLVGAGGASAYGGTGSGNGFGGFVFQINECDAATGDNTQIGAAGPTGDINVSPTCTNINGINGG